MRNTRSTDLRLDKIFRLLEHFALGDYSYREPYEEQGGDADEIVKRLNSLGEKIRQSGQAIANYERRVSALMDVLLKYTLFDFSEKAEVGETGDELDAIALALNTLGEELRDKIDAEQRYRARLEQMAVVMEATVDAVIAADRDGMVTHCNASAERMFGTSLSECKGRPIGSLLSSRGIQDEIPALIEQVRKGIQVLNHEFGYRRSKGKTAFLSVTLTPVTDPEGKVLSIAAVVRDITTQKEAERELRESEERFRSLVEGVKDYAIFMLDPSGLISSWNSGARALHGFDEREVSGQHFSVFYPEVDRQSHLPGQMLKEAIQNGKSTRDVFIIRKGGEGFWANVLITTLHDPMGRLSGFSMITRDLTESRQKDEEISLYTRRLEQKNVELERINKELSSFTYVSSHDLQEPLRKIRTLSTRILETEHEKLSESGRDYFRRMEASARRMQELLRDIIDYSTISSSAEVCENCDLDALIRQVAASFEDQIRASGARLEIGELCPAYIIPGQFKKLISNLLSNSLKFASPARTPEIRITSRAMHGALPGDAEAGECEYCLIEVSDNGIGFEPHFSKQIFEVFQRLHSNELYPGTGIGLAICKKIVENHKGAIEATSQLNKGTTIRIYLPVR